jgi:hypothetical protein
MTSNNQSYGMLLPHQPFEQKKPQLNLLDFSKLPKYGSFETDIPLAIAKAKIISGRLQCTVTWEKRPNGV